MNSSFLIQSSVCLSFTSAGCGKNVGDRHIASTEKEVATERERARERERKRKRKRGRGKGRGREEKAHTQTQPNTQMVS